MEVCIWAFHLEYLQSIGIDTDKALEKPDFNQFYQKTDGEEGWQGKMMTSLPTHLSLYVLISLHTHLSTHSSSYFKKVMARKDGKERWRGRMMTSLSTYLSSYTLVSLYTCLPTHLIPHCLRSQKVFPALETIYVLFTYWGIMLSFLECH